jgi:Na+/H+-dicarboxylate symporter
LVVGIAKLGDLKSVGRIGGKALGWFFTASFTSLLIGMFWVNTLKPGAGLQLGNIDTATVAEVTDKTQSFSFQNFVEHIIPKSIVEAMATNEILQIVIFSIFFGLAAASIGDFAKPVVNALDKTSHIVLKMVNYVMKFAPLGVFGAIAGVFAIRDLNELLLTYAKFFGSFLIGISSLWVILLLIGYIFLKSQMTTLLKRIVSPLIIAFGTTSSEAVFPKLTEELERFGVKDKIVSFMLPLGYSFNLDGSMMYMTFASIFIAQAYGVHLDFGTQMTMLLVLMLTSKGIAGVPRASLVVVAATCGMFDIPIEGIALILPIDHFCDMFRSATNVLGNALATSVVGKWEKD